MLISKQLYNLFIKHLFQLKNKYIKSQFFKFILVGGIGALTNLAIFFIFADILKYHHIPVAILAFIISASQNYFLNHYWTFANITKNKNADLSGLIRFIFVALIGLAINILILLLVISVFNPHYKVVAQAVGIAAGAIFNFAGSKYWIFENAK